MKQVLRFVETSPVHAPADVEGHALPDEEALETHPFSDYRRGSDPDL
ncbi:MAG: hypothetical protein ACRDN6_06670 [Gaiellaceae bacterium]